MLHLIDLLCKDFLNVIKLEKLILMKIKKVYKDNTYLIIETDLGIRKLKLNYNNIDEIEKKCINFFNKQCLVDYKTLKGWSKNLWFVDIWEVNEFGKEVSEETLEEHQSDINTNNITLNSFQEFDGFQNSNILQTTINDKKFVQKIFGPPGTGKTTKLINEIVKLAIENGVKSEEIAFLGYTNASCEAALSSLGHSNLKSGKINFPYFRTLHSMSTKIARSSYKLMTTKDRYEFDPSIKFKEEWISKGDSSSIVERPEHPVLDKWSKAIQKKEKFDHNILDVEDLLSLFFKKEINEIRLRLPQFVHSYIKLYIDFKKNKRLLDFDDVLLDVVDRKKVQDFKFPKLNILIIDEAQDLSNLQWDFVTRLIEHSNQIYLAGDDDQAIMTSFGASPDRFKFYKTDKENIFHKVSYRIPINIKKYVDCGVMKDIENLDNRVHKTWHSKIDEEKGSIYFMSSNFDDRIKNQQLNQSDYEKQKVKVFNNFNGKYNKPLSNWTPNDLIEHLANNHFENWLILTPTNNSAEFLSKGLSSDLFKIPHFFKNKPILDAQTFKHGINIRTIHTSKGLGAENVAIVALSIADIMMLGDEDPRLAYVALTRAKKTLIPRVVSPGLFGEILNNKFNKIELSNYLYRFPMPKYISSEKQYNHQSKNEKSSSKENISNEETFIQKIIKINPLIKPYIEILELKTYDSITDVRKNYRRLAKKWHPDTTNFDKTKTNVKEQFLKIKDAYEKIIKFFIDENI